MSYFDHDSPNFVQDGLIVTASGTSATADSDHQRTDFPGYWDPALRQYIDYDGHNGYDYDLVYQPVYAAAAGKVIFAAMEYPDAPSHGYGNMIMVSHRGGYVTLYGHLSKLSVHVGQKVRRGQRIAVSGNTGHSTGPHLHFTVFHNCSPTDPYGWHGSGDDPLSAYQGETSVPLWRTFPLVLNPPPHWPGLDAMGRPGVERRLLLRLPSTRGGAKGFEHRLRFRIDAALRSLRALGAVARADMLRGAVVVHTPLAPAELYRIPGVVSILSTGTVDGSKQDVLAALARATLAAASREQPLDRSHAWTGYLVRWDGRAVLVGRGTRGHAVALRLPPGARHEGSRQLRANPHDGTYAVDLGHLSHSTYRALAKELRGASSKPAALALRAQTHPAVVRVPLRPGNASHSVWYLLPALLLVAGGAGLFLWKRRPN